MNSSTAADHSVALGAEQKSIWCYSGIDLFVSLQIDSTESTRVDSLSSWASSDGPRPAQVDPHDSFVTSPDGIAEECLLIARTFHNEERKQFEMSREDSEPRSRTVGGPSCTTIARRERDELDGEVPRKKCRVLAQVETRGEQIRGQGKQSASVEARRSVPGVAVRRFIAKFVSPLAGQRYEPPCRNYSAETSSVNRQVQESNDQPDERFSEDDYEKGCDPEGWCRQCNSPFLPVVTGCRCLAVNECLGELKSVTQEDLENQPKDQSRMDDEFYSCNQNRSWTPLVEDYSSVPVDMNIDLGIRLTGSETGCSEGSTDTGEELDHDYPHVPSSLVSENAVVEPILQLEHSGNPRLDTLLPSNFPDIESFDVAEILAACQLVKMSAYDYGKDFGEQELSAMTVYDVNNLGFRDESNESRLSKMVETVNATIPATMPGIHVSNTRNALQLELSPWSDEDRYIPRIARRARGRLRGAHFSTRIDFGNTEADEDGDCEILRRAPTKCQYKSTQELLLA